MIFQWVDMGIDFELFENRVCVLVLENQDVYSEFMSKLQASTNGDIGAFALYEGEKKLSINKNIEIVFSPLLLDLNNKRIQQFLFKELKNLSNEVSYTQKEMINVQIVNYLDELSRRLPYPIRFNLNLDETLLYRQYDVRIEYDEGCLLEKLINYIQISSALCGTKVLFLCNIKAYFTSEQLQEIYSCAAYNKIYIILIENFESSCCIQGEKYYIIDKDKCFIQYD